MSGNAGGSTRKRLLIAVIMLLIPFLLIELGLRVFGFGQAILYREDAAAGYRPVPSQRFHTMGFPIQILPSGYRAPVEKSDTLFVGDSVTYGTASVHDEETFPALLGGVNAGTNGYGPQNIEAFLRSTELAGYRRVVWVMPSADVLRPFGVLRDGVVRAAGFIGPNKPMSLRLEYLFRFAWYGFIKTEQNASPSPAEYEKNLESVVKAAELLKEKGIELVLVFLPYREEVKGGTMPETPFVEKMTASLTERGVPFVRVRPPVEEAPKFYRDTTHLTAPGNRWLAGELRPLLEKSPSG